MYDIILKPKRTKNKKNIIFLHNFNQLNEIYEKIIILPQKEVVSKIGYLSMVTENHFVIPATVLDKFRFQRVSL